MQGEGVRVAHNPKPYYYYYYYYYYYNCYSSYNYYRFKGDSRTRVLVPLFLFRPPPPAVAFVPSYVHADTRNVS